MRKFSEYGYRLSTSSANPELEKCTSSDDHRLTSDLSPVGHVHVHVNFNA